MKNNNSIRPLQAKHNNLIKITDHDNHGRPRSNVVNPLKLDSSNLNQSEIHYSLSLLNRIFPDIDLTNIQLAVFLQSWQGKTYLQISESTGYDADYLKDVGHKLWRKISEVLGEPISKHNFSSILRRRFQELHELETETPAPEPFKFSTQNYRSHTPDPTPVCDWGEAAEVPVFMGHGLELSQLSQWIIDDNNRLVGIFGLGGIGKTALAVKCVEQVRKHFDYVIWRSLRDQPDFDDLIIGLLQCLTSLPLADLPETPAAKVSLLLDCFNRYRCMLIVDDWFAVLCSHNPGFYQENYEHYGMLLRRLSESRHQSSVLIISREQPAGLAFKDNQGFPVQTLNLRGLEGEDGRDLLRAFGLSETDAALDRFLECYSGNPYALRVAAKTVSDLFGGSISKFLEQGDLVYGDIRSLLNHQFSRLSQLERRIVDCLAKSPDWVSLSDLGQNIAVSNHNESLLLALGSLCHRGFIEKQGTYFNLPSLLRGYRSSQMAEFSSGGGEGDSR